MTKGTAIAAIIIALGGGLLIGYLVGKGGGGSDSNEYAAILDDSVERYRVPITDKHPSKGSADAYVTIVESSDFQCPFCKRVLPTIEKIVEEYGDKVRVVWMNNPLPFHSNAGPAAQLAMEAFEQKGDKGFWAAHDMLFENQTALTRDNLISYAKKLGLDVAKVEKAIDSSKFGAAISADQALLAKLGARGTPAFFLNGRKLMGAMPYENFKEVIDDEIARAEKLIEAGVDADELYDTFMENALQEEVKEGEKKADAAPKQKTPDTKAVYKVPVNGEPQRGPDDALVTIVEFSDFECPFCSRVEPTMDEIEKKYGRDVRIVWMNNPLPFHQRALPAAQAAHEVFVQKGAKAFWKMNKLLFENQRALGESELLDYAKKAGANPAKVKAALEADTHKAAIEKQQGLARSLGANGTPAFFINGRNLSGAQPLPSFVALIDEELKKAKALVDGGVARKDVYAKIIEKGKTTPQFVGGDKPSAAAAPAEPQFYKVPMAANAPFKGGKKAKVVIQEFSDFQCPFCGRVGPTLKKVQEEYGDKVKIVWRNYPLPFHAQAVPAHIAAIEVFKQGGSDKFWKYHDILFENQRALATEDLVKYAKQVGGIDTAKLTKAIESKAHEGVIEADKADITKAGARIGTPSFFINGKLLQGAQPYEEFKKLIDEALKG